MNVPTTIPAWLTRRIPAVDWLAHYERKNLRGDALAGVIVATLLIPQAMAYHSCPVMDRLADTDFLEQLGSERVFLSTEQAYEKLATPNLP